MWSLTRWIPMQRGGVVAVAASGDYGKPRPAIVVQTDASSDGHASVIVCRLTSALAEAAEFRVTIKPDAENGLGAISQVMADKSVTIGRTRVGQHIGWLQWGDMVKLNAAPAFVMGLAD